MGVVLPSRVKKYFWGDNLDQLNWRQHKQYISQTLLDKGDVESISWLFNKIDLDQIKEMLPSLKLSPKSLNFWKLYLS